MKQRDLLEIIQDLGLSLPEFGTGRNRKIINRDLEDVIGDHFFTMLPEEEKFHMDQRMQIRPMKAFRFDKLTKAQQDEVLLDDNNWAAEHKLDGFRMIISYVPGNYNKNTPDRLRFYGGNLSTVTFLPVDYTDHVLLSKPIKIPDHYISPLLIDCEVICNDMVMTQDGLMTTNTREAVAAILGCSPLAAKTHQVDGAKLLFRGFNIISPEGHGWSYDVQQNGLKAIDAENEGNTHFKRVLPIRRGKLQYAQRLWKQGEEGLVIKNTKKSYVSGGRQRDVAVKLKRTMSGEIGDYIDAFITSFVLTEEHSKDNLIGGVILSVWLNGEQHELATVSNMPDAIRKELTVQGADGAPKLNPMLLGKVLEVDGQELSTRYMKLMHAVVKDWDFRTDKNESECIMEMDDMGGDF